MTNTVVLKRASLAKFKKQPKPAMTPDQLRLIAQRTTQEVEALANRKASGQTRPEDQTQEFTEWL